MISYVEHLEEIVKAIVNHPDAVKVDKIVDERGVLLTVNIHPEDVSYVIGKQGQTITSLRTLVRIVGSKHDARVTVKVNEPEGSRGPRPRTESSDRPVREERPAYRPSPRPAAKKEEEIDTSVVDNLEI